MRRTKVVRGAGLALILLFAYLSYIAYSIVQYSDQSSPVRADAAIVLGAAVWDKEPSPVLQGRMNQAILLYQEGRVHKVITTGGVGEGATISEAEAGRRYAAQAGVLEVDILLEEASVITEENLANALRIAQEHQLQSFAIVSDPLHMKRAMTMAKDLGMTAYPSPTDTSTYVSWRAKGPFLVRETLFLFGYQVKRLFV